ncbi:head scaffolding protein [Streptomyces phage Rowa]|uniref:Scaffolding protein n=1 Tax=Streptomyces phage Rowa TaxID=2059883 RepID=A0A2H5BLQ7_9CAUD|nr:head scaffolding protein [Streptomyces phage Rowa]AUG87270.1 scaffolding protein [Streptomyces phage Rowa]
MSENPNPNGPESDGTPKDGDPAEGTGNAPANGPENGAEGDQGEAGEDALGDAGKKALKTERDARKAAEKERDALQAEVKRLQRSNAAVKGTDLEAIKTEIRAEFQTQLAETAIKAEAKGRLHDPSDALLFIKPADVDTSDDTAIEKAVTELLKARPYLAKADSADSGSKPWGDVGGGKTPSTEPEPASPEERMRRAYGKASN